MPLGSPEARLAKRGAHGFSRPLARQERSACEQLGVPRGMTEIGFQGRPRGGRSRVPGMRVFFAF